MKSSTLKTTLGVRTTTTVVGRMEDLPDDFEVKKLPRIETENFRVDTPSPLMEYDLKQTVNAEGMTHEKKLDILKFVKEKDSAYIRGTFGKNADTGEIEWVSIDQLFFGGKLSREDLLDFIELSEGIDSARVTERIEKENFCSLTIEFI